MSKLKFTFLLSCLMIVVATISAQTLVPSIQWQGVYGGTAEEKPYSIKQTKDGGYILGGFSASGVSGNKTTIAFGSTGNDYWVVKTDKNGAIVWQKSYGGTGNDVLYEIDLTSDGGYILTGTSSSNISGNKADTNRAGSTSTATTDIWIVKLDDTGKIQWQKTLGGTGNETMPSSSVMAQALKQTFDGGYILACTSASGKNGDKTDTLRGTTGSDLWVVKMDNVGTIQWQKTIGGSSFDAAGCVRQTADTGYLLFAQSQSTINNEKTDTCRGSYDWWVIKLDRNGAIQWQKTLGGSLAEYPVNAWPTEDGGYLLGGFTQSGKTGEKTDTSRGANDSWFVKLDAAHNIQWQKSMGSKSNDAMASFTRMSNGHYFLGVLCTNNSASGAAGRANAKTFDRTDTGVAIYDMWLLEIDTAANIIWQKAIGANKAGTQSTVYNVITASTLTSDDGMALIAYSNADSSAYKTIPQFAPNSLVNDYWVIKMGVNMMITKDSICRYNTFTVHNGDVVNTAGEYRDTVFKNNTIDSVFVNDLSIIHVDTSVSQTGFTLTANATGATYQWMYCATNQPVPSATLASFTPVADGGYKVVVTKSGCSDTSSCHNIHGVGVAQVQAGSNSVSVYPNPSNGVLNIVANNAQSMNVQVIDMLGNLLVQQTYNSANATMDISRFPAGTYLVKVNSNNNYSLVKITKTN